jgi:hypothetical protein
MIAAMLHAVWWLLPPRCSLCARQEVAAKLNTNQSEQQQQQQQQRRQHDKASLKTQMESQAVKRDASRADGRGGDGERTRDLKRGRILPTDKPDEQQEQLMKLQEALRKEADSVSTS